MLLPALAKAKDRAGRISCVSNVKQLALAMMMYVDDHHHQYPTRMPDPEPGPRFRASRVERLIGVLMPRRISRQRPGLDEYDNASGVFVCRETRAFREIAADPFHAVQPRPRRFPNTTGAVIV